MRRAIVMLALLLGLGLCTSVLVAWAGALVDRTSWPDTILTRGPTGSRTAVRGWLVEAGRDRTLTWRTFRALDLWDEPPDLEASTELPAWSVGHELPDQPGPFAPARERTRDEAWELSAGWPMRCVRAVRVAGPAEFALPGEFVRGGVVAMAVEWPTPTSRAVHPSVILIGPWPADGLAAIVPLRPMPVGLFVNTVVFTALWFLALLPLVAPRAVRRRRRARRNRCVACGYARDGLPDGAPCAECGRDPAERTTLVELVTARAPTLGALLALVLVVASGAVLATPRWSAVDRLPPLHHAAAVGDVEEVERLLAGGAVATRSSGWLNSFRSLANNREPLHWAAARGHVDISRVLLDAGADPLSTGGSSPTMHLRFSSLYLAAVCQHDRVVGMLLDRVIARRGNDHLCFALSLASPATMQVLLNKLAWTQEELVDAAAYAVSRADHDRLSVLVGAGLDPSIQAAGAVLVRAVVTDSEALKAPYHRDLGLTARAIDLGFASSVSEAREAIWAAIGNANTAALDALLARHPGLHDELANATPYLIDGAVSHGRRGMFDRLVRAGASIDAPHPSEATPLRVASLRFDAFAVALLLEAGADPTAVAQGQTAREVLEHRRRFAFNMRDRFPDSEYLLRADDVQRILDMLEAAEAEWHARAHEHASPGDR